MERKFNLLEAYRVEAIGEQFQIVEAARSIFGKMSEGTAEEWDNYIETVYREQGKLYELQGVKF